MDIYCATLIAGVLTLSHGQLFNQHYFGNCGVPFIVTKSEEPVFNKKENIGLMLYKKDKDVGMIWRVCEGKLTTQGMTMFAGNSSGWPVAVALSSCNAAVPCVGTEKECALQY